MKKLLFTMVVAAFGAAFGAANDTILVFSTKGPDTYADGTTVLDGERYALVWVKDGTEFAGLAVDGTPLADTTKLIAVAPLAKGGKCTETVFEIDADFAETLKGGSVSLYLLDTRVTKTELAKADKLSVNAIGPASPSPSPSTSTSTSPSTSSSTSVALATVGVYTKIDEPTITAMKVSDATVELKVSGMVDAADYFVVPGSTPSAFKPALSIRPVGDTFIFDKTFDATFFKVIGVRKF